MNENDPPYRICIIKNAFFSMDKETYERLNNLSATLTDKGFTDDIAQSKEFMREILNSCDLVMANIDTYLPHEVMEAVRKVKDDPYAGL